MGKIVLAEKSETLVMIGSHELKIFTCYVDKFVSYYMYISAFDRTVWIMILLSGLLMNGLLYLHIRRNVPSAIEFSPLLFYFSTFTEESFNAPLTLSTDKVYRIAVSTWLLLSVIFTNTYVSNVISEIEVSLPGERISSTSSFWAKSSRIFPKNVQEVKEIRLFYVEYQYNISECMQSRKMMELYQSRKQTKNPTNFTFLKDENLYDGFALLSKPTELFIKNVEDKVLQVPGRYSVFLQFFGETFECSQNNSLTYPYCSYRVKFLLPVNRHYPLKPSFEIPIDTRYAKTAIENELVQCGKSAYVEGPAESELKYLSEMYPEKRFYYLKDLIKSGWSGFKLERLENSKTYVALKRCLDSLIFQYFREINLSYVRRVNGTKLIKKNMKTFKMDMESQLQKVFVLALAMLLVANGAFFVEYTLTVKFNYYLLKLTKCIECKGRLRLKNLHLLNECFKYAGEWNLFISMNIKASLAKLASKCT